MIPLSLHGAAACWRTCGACDTAHARSERRTRGTSAGELHTGDARQGARRTGRRPDAERPLASCELMAPWTSDGFKRPRGRAAVSTDGGDARTDGRTHGRTGARRFRTDARTDARTHGRTDARTHGRTHGRTHDGFGRTDARTTVFFGSGRTHVRTDGGTDIRPGES